MTRWSSSSRRAGCPTARRIQLAIHGPGGHLVEELPKGYVIKNSRCSIKHKIDWKHEHLKELPTGSEAPEFRFEAVVARFELSARSNDLYVDLGGYVVSG